MTPRRYTLSLVIHTLVQVVCVSCQCDNSPVVTRVPLYHTASITSPGYPENYAINLNCSWIFDFENDTDYFFVRMDDVYVDCKGDVIRLIELRTHTDIVSFCEDATTSDVYTRSGNLRVEFTTNGVQRDNDRGFRLYVTSIPRVTMSPDAVTCPTEGELSADKNIQVLTSTNFPKKYPSGQTCYWKIPSKTGYEIVITVDIIDIEYGSTPPHDPVDFLQILYYTEGSLTPQNHRYSGRWNFRPVSNNVITSVGDVTITFMSDSDTSYSGFLLRYKLVELSSAQTTTENDSSSSDNEVIVTEVSPITTEESVSTTEESVVTISTTGDTTSTTEDKISTSEDTITTTEYKIMTSEDAKSTSEDTISTTEDKIMTSEDTITTTEDKIMTSEDTITTYEKILSTSTGMSLSTSTENTLTSEDTISTFENSISTSEETLSTSEQQVVTTDTTIPTSDDITSNDHVQTTKATVSMSGTATSKEIDGEEIVIPRYVSKIVRRTSSCDLSTCVIPLVVAIGLLLSVLFVVIVALGVTRSRRRDRYHVRKAIPCRPIEAETPNGDFDL